MEVRHPRCAVLDVHKETVVTCVRIVSGGEVSRAVRTFETTTARLIELAEWLEASGCTHLAMEATKVYWKPVWQVLAGGGFELVLALPAICEWPEMAASACLASYGTTICGLYALEAALTHKMLHGASPADTPAQQPTKFQLVVNLKTTKALGFTVPQSILFRADEVIE